MDILTKDIEKSALNSDYLSGSLWLQPGYLNDLDNLLGVILYTFALGEMAIDKKDVVYWSISENLDKHRETREFDQHLQKMLLFLERIGDFDAKEVSCGGNGFYRTLLRNPQTGECILVVHSWDHKAQYMKKYLGMNADMLNPKFALLQYDLDKSRTKLQNLKIVIPGEDGDTSRHIDLMSQVNEVRKTLPMKCSVSETIQSVKNRLGQTQDKTLKEAR